MGSAERVRWVAVAMVGLMAGGLAALLGSRLWWFWAAFFSLWVWLLFLAYDVARECEEEHARERRGGLV